MYTFIYFYKNSNKNQFFGALQSCGALGMCFKCLMVNLALEGWNVNEAGLNNTGPSGSEPLIKF